MPTTTSPLTPATHGLRVAASFNCSYGKFTNMESPLPEGSSNILIIRFLWVTIALIFFP